MESKDPIGISVLVVIATIGIIAFVFFIILFILFYQKRVLINKGKERETEKKHQLQLIKDTMEIAEFERKKIAENIHDDIGTALNVLKMYLTRISRNQGDKQLVEGLISESSELLGTTIENIRGIQRDLMPPALVKLGYEKGLSDLCRQINETEVIKVCFKGLDQGNLLAAKIELQLYRISLEIINNIIKHAHAKQIDVSLRTTDEKFITIISHNGIGINSKQLNSLTEGSKGVGLKSIQNRAIIINASVIYIVENENESKIIIEVPIHEKEN